jgi:hypothetical protein
VCRRRCPSASASASLCYSHPATSRRSASRVAPLPVAEAIAEAVCSLVSPLPHLLRQPLRRAEHSVIVLLPLMPSLSLHAGRHNSPCSSPPSTQVLSCRRFKPSRAANLRWRGHRSCATAILLQVSSAPPPLWSLRHRPPALTPFTLCVQTVTESVAEAIHVDGSLRAFPGPTGTSQRIVCTPATSPTGRPPSFADSPAGHRRAPPSLLHCSGQGLPMSHPSPRRLNRVPHKAVLP